MITIVGGGLAGSEAAWQIASRGIKARLFEMRPVRRTPAHTTDRLAEIVCSNSLKSDQPFNASWLLKEELRRMGSLLIRIADSVRVPAGSALAVDREHFAAKVTDAISSHSHIELVREEVTAIPEDGLVIIASGPLTSPSLSESIARFCGSEHLYFYDAISPIVNADTIDASRVYRASRYGKAADDYINCPMDRDQYDTFYNALISAESVALHEFEEAHYFESCLPIEELARRGRETLRYGPMRPVGLADPRTGRPPYAVVQLRQEDLMQSSYNLVGFQNHLKFDDQRRVFRTIPGLESAEFLRLGQIHRNTYINAPQTLLRTMAARKAPRVFFAGQLAGTEGYIENVASGLVAGINAVQYFKGEEPVVFPDESAIGSLCRYVSTPQKDFAPMNIHFGLLPPMELPRRIAKSDKQRLFCERALASLGSEEERRRSPA
ncbi:MAG TPA: methylenetetrahydrofolate--tRNA-(uracil(54)-C(5))-methyltransferase (FADH(2)-oxidizing) TrmFO [Terriglobia bacterium]|jgi:methylenetetrahydrofolate--tRNA-(uracil-5-)-methyltransferase|nr:methylenetetrahydrofolate--tRNA-(uracil(54)-C(5))-methyltransferase (FADH(2)-oxidizing) TrmFO [Terriglobia bacterium]